jgi:hypothetical protein
MGRSGLRALIPDNRRFYNICGIHDGTFSFRHPSSGEVTNAAANSGVLDAPSSVRVRPCGCSRREELVLARQKLFELEGAVGAADEKSAVEPYDGARALTVGAFSIWSAQTGS